ncbi:hypothetical protein OOK36_39260 [Streptomyces sp. NBC_00365]|uniref:hypothetical protein n=1 Tax=Streptomyces sp. NBC_00365 TaxID=2975726 RepID=UPI0022505741|nr:hypothetical protein [Streptomyces sp. NBC_00365]MCX5094791.1 hypothetical protein [Streptomyces sp. NBC_00365]
MEEKRASDALGQVEESVLDLLRTPPSGKGVPPPVVTKDAYLPLGELSWPDVERLFLRLAERMGKAEEAQRYGTPGQDQAGIDLFIRNSRQTTLSSSDLVPERRYITLQSKRVAKLNAAQIRKAVDKFLQGKWVARSEVFIYATTHDLTSTEFADELNRQADQLENLGIRLVWWGRDQISEMLRTQHDVVDERDVGDPSVPLSELAAHRPPAGRLGRSKGDSPDAGGSAPGVVCRRMHISITGNWASNSLVFAISHRPCATAP